MEEQNALSKQTRRALEAASNFGASSAALSRIVEDMNRNDRILRAALGPSEELRRAIDSMSSMTRSIDPASLAAISRFQDSMADLTARFRLPEFGETARALQAHQETFARIAASHADSMSAVQRAMESMKSPWLDTERILQSMEGMASLHGIGNALKTMPGFSDNLSDLLRSHLGDWRDPIVLPENITDIAVRTGFYDERGFDSALTGFPADAFDEGVEVFGIRVEPPPIVLAYGPPVPPSSDVDEEAGFGRTNTAHDWLQRMESHLRSFIDTVMTNAHGPDWPKSRLPNGVYDQWQGKKQKAEQAGRPAAPLIAYADFNDYVLVVGRSDNWPLFAPFFTRIESFRESMQRLHPIRLDVAHSRIITQDDEIYLYVEVHRLIKITSKS